MKTFWQLLRKCNPPAGSRRWLYVPYDQLNDRLGPLAAADPRELGIVLIESSWKGNRRPYHKQKLALILANQRHFALEQARRGVSVRYLFCSTPYCEALKTLVPECGQLQVMEPAERELRIDLAPLVASKALQVIPHEGWLTTVDDFRTAAPDGPPWRMDAFYRQVRRRTGILMERGKPLGGKFSFDAENRQPWKGEPPAPESPVFTPDEVTREVGALIEHAYADHPGQLDLNALPATHEDALRMWQWALENALPMFGPFEDAMSTRSRGLFHSRMSALINLHRILPRQVVEDVLALEIPLASKEGFVRQVLGWREFVRHVHRETDGFRTHTNLEPASPNFLSANNPLPAAFWPWGTRSGLNCLDTVVADVWQEAYSHHITRLMVLSNIATLLDVSPRELTDWFWVAYADAYDWVVEPNVLGMGTYAVGDLMTTKPYISGAAYIHKMSDYCGGCQFDPKSDCPLTRLYWAFLNRHRDKLSANQRLKLPLASAAKRSNSQQAQDQETFRQCLRLLAAGKPLSPVELRYSPNQP